MEDEIHLSESLQTTLKPPEHAKRPRCDDPPEVDALLPFLVPTESTEISSPSAGFSAGGITLHEDDLKSLQPGAWLNDNNAEALLKDAEPASVQPDHMESLRGYILKRLIGAHH
ncbi:Non-structural protein NS2 [Dissostichus eleginoides]|uniref:Non-structural protein NS2 n=1 Tax=Dissostichus eleginoides TaxID=100907 RepID=A0AAD9FJW4_DISEL|nr:Non-structural protein NS2 [Dissostichus eleginoides]